jgi:hypothetical protein
LIETNRRATLRPLSEYRIIEFDRLLVELNR